MRLKPIIAAILAIALAAALGGCTPSQEQAAVVGVQTACNLAVAGTTVYVQVESSNGATAQNISKEVNGDTAIACPVIVASAQAAVNSITASGATATVSVSVSTSTPTASKRKVVAKVQFKAVAGEMKATFVVKPDFVIPFFGAL